MMFSIGAKRALASVALGLSLTTTAYAVDCPDTGCGCDADVNIEVTDEEPTALCPMGERVYRVTITVKCAFLEGQASELVCSVTDLPITVNLTQYPQVPHIHTFQPRKDYKWIDVVSDCSKLEHICP